MFLQDELKKAENTKKEAVKKYKEEKDLFDSEYNEIELIVKVLKEISDKIKNNEFDSSLDILDSGECTKKFPNNVLSHEEVTELIRQAKDKLTELFDCSLASECANLSNELRGMVSDLLLYVEMKKNEFNSFSEKDEEEKISALNSIVNFVSSTSINLPFHLWCSLDDDPMYFKFNFWEDKNLIFLHETSNENCVSAAFEDIFTRMLYQFDPNVIEIQVIGSLPISFRGFIGSVNNALGSATIFREIIITNEDALNYIKSLYDLVLDRSTRYYADGDFDNYNKNHPDNPDKAIFVYLHNYPTCLPEEADACIKTLLDEECHKYGLFFLVNSCLVDSRRINFENDDIFGKKFYAENGNISDGKIDVNFDLYNSTFDRRTFFNELSEKYNHK